MAAVAKPARVLVVDDQPDEVAEGPETVQQAQLLRLLKCDQIQGYVVARPQPAAQVSELLGKTMSFAPAPQSIAVVE